MDTLAIATEELAEIDQAIAKKMAELGPLQQRREKLRAYLALTGELFGPAAAQAQINGHAPDVMVTQRSTSTAAVIMLSEAIVKEAGQMQTRDLMPRLEERGAVIFAKDKLAALSAIISKSGKFDSDRKRGWSLKGDSPDASRASGLSGATRAVEART